jgi:Family of unknown function (DUF6232)
VSNSSEGQTPSRQSSRFGQLDPFSSGRVVINGDTLRFGKRSFAAGEIASYRIESGEKSSFIGNICAFSIFLCLAALIMQAMVGQIFPPRTLIGVITLGCVGLASVQDTWRERGDGFYSLFVTANGAPDEILVFATSEREEVEQVAARVAGVIGKRG